MDIKEVEYCICDTPDIKVEYDDTGRQVRYCDRCWKPIEENEDDLAK